MTSAITPPMKAILFGIKNCDTVRKARRWLDDNGIDYLFTDLRMDGLDEQRLRSWLEQAGTEQLINKRSATWRRLPEEQRLAIYDSPAACKLLIDNPTLIKRPVLQQGKTIHIGFSAERYKALFKT